MTQWTLSATTPVAIVRAGDGPSLIINRSITNSILIGADSSIVSPGYVGVSIIDPLGTMAVTGLVDVYGVAAAGSALVNVQDNAVAWSASPAQIAAQIAINGIPLLASQKLVSSATNLNVPLNNLVSLASQTFGQVSYALEITSQWVSAPADGMNFHVILNWFDSNSGTLTEQDVFTIGGGASTDGIILKTLGTGPAKGNQLQAVFQNIDGTSAITVNARIFQTSITTTKDKWRHINKDGAFVHVPGYTSSGQLPDNSQNPGFVMGGSVPASSTQKILFSLCNGNVWFTFSSGTALAIQITPTPSASYGNLTAFSTSVSNFQGQITLPRCPVVVNFVNSSGAAISYNAMMTAWE